MMMTYSMAASCFPLATRLKLTNSRVLTRWMNAGHVQNVHICHRPHLFLGILALHVRELLLLRGNDVRIGKPTGEDNGAEVARR